MLVITICKILLGKDYSFDVDFIAVAVKQLWVKRYVSTHKSHLQSMFKVSYLALRQSPAVGYQTQSVLVFVVGFALYAGSNLSWVGADWCGDVPQKDAVSAGSCPWLDDDIPASGLVNCNHIWLPKPVILLTSAEVVDLETGRVFGKSVLTGHATVGVIYQGIYKTTKIICAGHQIAEEVPEDTCNGWFCRLFLLLRADCHHLWY